MQKLFSDEEVRHAKYRRDMKRFLRSHGYPSSLIVTMSTEDLETLYAKEKQWDNKSI